MERFENMPMCNKVVRITHSDFLGKVDYDKLLNWLATKDIKQGENYDVHAQSLNANKTFPIAKAVLAQNEDDCFQIWLFGPIDNMGNLNWFSQLVFKTIYVASETDWQEHLSNQIAYTAYQYREIINKLKTLEKGHYEPKTNQNE